MALGVGKGAPQCGDSTPAPSCSTQRVREDHPPPTPSPAALPSPPTRRSRPDTEYVACANKLDTFVKSRKAQLEQAVGVSQPAAAGAGAGAAAAVK